MSASNDVKTAIYETLPAGLRNLLASPTYLTFATCAVPTDKDSAIIAQGILAANLNALFKSIFDQTSLAELMLYAGSVNPCHLGILLASLSLGSSNYQMGVVPTVIPQYEDVDGTPTMMGATVTITPQPGEGASAPERAEISVPGLFDKYVASPFTTGADIVIDTASMSASDFRRYAGTAVNFYKDGISKACDFVVDLTGLGG